MKLCLHRGMPRSSRKRQLLRQEGRAQPQKPTPSPGRVISAKASFSTIHARIRQLQVKYEMLQQKLQIEGQPVEPKLLLDPLAFPRQLRFIRHKPYFSKKAGLVGLLPHKRGPRGGHKVDRRSDGFRQPDPSKPGYVLVLGGEIGRLIQERFPISIHPRSIARQSGAVKKNAVSQAWMRLPIVASMRNSLRPMSNSPQARYWEYMESRQEARDWPSFWSAAP